MRSLPWKQQLWYVLICIATCICQKRTIAVRNPYQLTILDFRPTLSIPAKRYHSNNDSFQRNGHLFSYTNFMSMKLWNCYLLINNPQPNFAIVNTVSLFMIMLLQCGRRKWWPLLATETTRAQLTCKVKLDKNKLGGKFNQCNSNSYI